MAVGVQLPGMKKNLPCGHIVMVTVGIAMNSTGIYFMDVRVCVSSQLQNTEYQSPHTVAKGVHVGEARPFFCRGR